MGFWDWFKNKENQAKNNAKQVGDYFGVGREGFGKFGSQVRNVAEPIVQPIARIPQQVKPFVQQQIQRPMVQANLRPIQTLKAGYNSQPKMEGLVGTKVRYNINPMTNEPVQLKPVAQKIANWQPKNKVAKFAYNLVNDPEYNKSAQESIVAANKGIASPEQQKTAKIAAMNATLDTGGFTAGLAKNVGKGAKIVEKTTTIPRIPLQEQPATAKIRLSQPNQTPTPIAPEGISFDVNGYVNRQKVAQSTAEGKIGITSRAKTFLQDVKTKLVDSNAPIEDVLSKAEKDGQFKVIPTRDIRYQIDKVLRSDSLATQSLKDSGIDKVIREADDIDAFNQYLIAKQAQDVSKKGIKTGRNLSEDSAFVQATAEKYEPPAQTVYAHNRKVLDTLTDSGMISRELSNSLKNEYPNYVPLNRIFSEAEQSSMPNFGKSSAVASVGVQKVVKRLKGSVRDIENPLESILVKTSQAFEQAEKNKAARMLASYKDLPNNPFNLEEVVGNKPPGESVISFFDNGVKKVFKTDPEIANAAKNMSQQHIGLLGQLFNIPVRILKLGATGLNLPFVASNLVKDQAFATINSSRALKTSLANPANFGRSLFETLKQGQLYDDWVRSGASFTSWDMQRNATKPTVEAVRASKNAVSRIAYTVKHPSSFIKTLEDAIGKSEEVTRIQQFNGMRDALLKEGRTLQDATILAADASRNNTTNFARRGEWGTVLNSLIPYINAGIQGSRTLITSLKVRPAQTTFKLAGIVFTPVAMVTAWNLGDPKRKAAYDDIPEYEKEGNIVLIPDNPVKDENGRWNAIKIPMTPGVSNLASIVRRQLEGIDNFDGASFKRVAGDLLNAGTSINPLDSQKTLSQLMPQGLKPVVESATNTNLFTGQNIVPEYLKDAPIEDQVKKNTSGTARVIGGITGSSPLKVDNTIRTLGGGVSQQLVNASDKILAKGGIIPEDQIGGKGLAESFTNRFTSAAGGEIESKSWDAINKQEQAKKSENQKLIQSIIDGQMKPDGITSQRWAALVNSAEEKVIKENLSSVEKKLYDMSEESRNSLAQSNPQLSSAIEKVNAIKLQYSSKKTSMPRITLKKAGGGRKGRVKISKAPKFKNISKPKVKEYKLKIKRIS